ncbi:MAG: hypothetical protein DHS20C15_03160 [Planctomycetota bacterium]|nr:MAG: hypothetical protein DHS20C15_03160 [Planctomycetota bacterium]
MKLVSLCRLLFAALVLTPTLSSQVTLISSGCSGVNPTPTISHSGSLEPGLSSTISLSGAPPNSIAVFWAGTTATNAQGDPIAVSLSSIDGVGPGCELNILPNAMKAVVLTDGNGEVHFSFTVKTALGADLFFQFGVLEDDDPVSASVTPAMHLHLPITAAPTPLAVDLGPANADLPPVTGSLQLDNNGTQALTLDDLVLFDGDAVDFGALLSGETLPHELLGAESVNVDLSFAPTFPGPRSTTLELQHAALPVGIDNPLIEVSGFGLGNRGEDLFVNAGSTFVVDGMGQFWIDDTHFTGGIERFGSDPIAGAFDQAVVSTHRRATNFSYALPLPDGDFEVTLHFAETVHEANGLRVFDVTAEGVLVVDDLDLHAAAGHDVAHSESFVVNIADGVLDLEFDASVHEAMLAGIEIRRQFAQLEVTPAALDFGAVGQGSAPTLMLSIDNPGTDDLQLSTLTMSVDQGDGSDFSVTIDGNTYFGDTKSIAHALVASVPAGGSLPVTVTFAPMAHQDNDIGLEFDGNGDAPVLIDVIGTGGSVGHPFLHVVIEELGSIVDYNNDGSEDVFLDGSFSHTHEPDKVLTAWTWTEGPTPLGSGEQITPTFTTGDHTVTLTIEDDNVPGETLPGSVTFTVSPITAVPGVLANYFDTGATPPATLIDTLPSVPDDTQALTVLRVENNQGVGDSGLTTNVLVQLLADLDIDTADTYEFALSGGIDTRLFIDAVAYTGPVALGVGSHSIEARFAVDSVLDLPLEVTMAVTMMPPAPISESDLTHDETNVLPVMSSLTPEGSTLGGNLIVLQGFGFFPFDEVDVNWGAQVLTDADFMSITPTEITFLSPPHSAGMIAVSVDTPNGTSNSLMFEYSAEGPPPIAFNLFKDVGYVWNPTAIAWGPDGRLYIATRTGRLAAFEFDEDYNVLSQALYDGVVSTDPHRETLGIAFNPYDPPSPVRVYLAHSELFAQGGGSFVGESPYPGFVSYVEGPNFDTPVTLISGLPSSNHDHGVNGMVFDNNGDLLIAVGGNTNAGVISAPIGDIPESPLSAAIIKAHTSRPDFDGAITYADTDTLLVPNNDQVLGEVSSITNGHVTVHAPGLRNAYDLSLTANGRLYASDNGPNGGFGLKSTGPDTQGGQAAAPDELVRVESGVYYGHPNRARGRFDARQNIYHSPTDPGIPDEFRQTMGTYSSAAVGLDEYRATTFGSQLRGNLLLQRWNSHVRAVQLQDDGRDVVNSMQLIPPEEPVQGLDAIDVRAGPGGAILGVDYTHDDVNVMVPDDVAAVGLTAYDIFPWRGVATGGTPFVIGGENFGSLMDTSVTIGGLPATLTSVSSRRIHGTTPVQASPTTDLLDVVVTVGPEQATISEAFRYLFMPAGNEPGQWSTLTSAPGFASMGEVGAGEINGVIYVVGDDSPSTLAYDIASDTWTTGASRAKQGHHSAAEVIDGKLYLFGGLSGNAEGRVQIYDPVLDTWTMGTDMPWLAGSSSSAYIDGLVYVAGGFDNGVTTVDTVHAYDPVMDTWSAALSPMTDGRNHAASATDGEKLWVFGGRGAGSGDANVVANGFADIQCYDPVTDTWDSSNLMGSELQPLPIGRGGMGKAIYYQGEFYIFGGETLTGPGAIAGNVYDRVDVYNPETHTWRTETSMPTGRHGHFPVLFESKIYVLTGGLMAGHAHSTVAEMFTRQ